MKLTKFTFNMKNPKRFKTTHRIKRYYPTWFETMMNNNNNKWFNMSYIPMPQRTEDFTGAPIVEEPIDNSSQNALVSIAKAPLNLIMNTGIPNMLGNSWKSILFSQSVNAASFMLCKHYGWNTSGPTLKIVSSILTRYIAGTLIINPVTNPIGFLGLIYDAYNFGCVTAQSINTVKKVTTTVKGYYDWGASWLSWGTSFLYKTTPALKNTSRITGGDTSSIILDSANQTATLKQVLINNKPVQFEPTNYEIFMKYKDQLNNESLNTLVDQISYKSTLTDKLAQKYLNMTTDTVNVSKLIKSPFGKQNQQFHSNTSDTINSLNTKDPLIVGEYTNNIKGQEAIKLAENLIKAQKTDPISNKAPIIQNIETGAEEVVRELSFGGKLILTAMGIGACFIGYKFLSGKYPEFFNTYLNFDFSWISSLKTKIYNFFWAPKTEIIDVSDENITLHNQVFSEVIENKDNIKPFVDTLSQNSSLIDTKKNIIVEQHVINEIPTAPIVSNNPFNSIDPNALNIIKSNSGISDENLFNLEQQFKNYKVNEVPISSSEASKIIVDIFNN